MAKIAETIFKLNTILYLINHIAEEQKRKVRIYLDIGDEDFLDKGNTLLDISMCDLSILYEYRVRGEGHNWGYWKSSLPNALKFISNDW
jgi:S-formylglutathione hydrolase FrmB